MEYVITNLNSVCSNCGFFDSESSVNNGYGCNHRDNEDPKLIKIHKGQDIEPDFKNYYSNNEDVIIAKSFTTRNIKCSRRLAKKFWRKAINLTQEQRENILNSKGYYYRGQCFGFACPISWSIDFESIKNYGNSSDFQYIENEKEMPWGWGDDLMGIEKSEADKLGIKY